MSKSNKIVPAGPHCTFCVKHNRPESEYSTHWQTNGTIVTCPERLALENFTRIKKQEYKERTTFPYNSSAESALKLCTYCLFSKRPFHEACTHWAYTSTREITENCPHLIAQVALQTQLNTARFEECVEYDKAMILYDEKIYAFDQSLLPVEVDLPAKPQVFVVADFSSEFPSLSSAPTIKKPKWGAKICATTGVKISSLDQALRDAAKREKLVATKPELRDCDIQEEYGQYNTSNYSSYKLEKRLQKYADDDSM